MADGPIRHAGGTVLHSERNSCNDCKMMRDTWDGHSPVSSRPPHWQSSLRRSLLVASMIVVLVGVIGVATQIGSQAASSDWTIVTSPSTSPPADDIVLGSACANADQCWNVGVTINNINNNSTFSPLVESWNGTNWLLASTPEIPAGNGGGLFATSCVNGSDCWAVGAVLGSAGNGSPTGTLIEHWDGFAWSIVPSPTPDGVSGALLQSVSCTSSSNCVAVGFTTDQNGENLNSVVERWDGSTWTIQQDADPGQAFDQLDAVHCLSANDCWAVGNAGPNQQNPNFLPIFPGAVGDQGLIEHWDGVTWAVTPSSILTSPDGGYLNGITCTNGSDCWASGATTDATGMASGVLMQHWNGSVWSTVPASVPDGSTGAILTGLACISSVQCWAAGSSGSFGGGGGSGFQPRSFIDVWNGSTWTVDASPNVTALSFLTSVSCVQGAGCWAVGSTATESQQNDPGLQSLIEQLIFSPAASQSADLVAQDGGVFTLGKATFFGSMGGRHLNKPIVGIAPTPDGGGYWLVASDGGIFTFGDASFYGSTGGQHLNKPIVGIAPTPDGGGYWLVASDGGVFSFGDANFYGSMGSHHLNQPIVGLASTGDGAGYWMVASDGGVFTFGDATFLGSTGGEHLNRPISGISTTPDGLGYWMVASDGGIFSFGDARFHGSVPGQGIYGQPPVVGIARTPSGMGYWLVGSGGALYDFGDAAQLGPLPGTLAAPVSGIAAS
jgi:hypothetical protein